MLKLPATREGYVRYLLLLSLRNEILRLRFGLAELDRYVLARSDATLAAYTAGTSAPPEESSEISAAAAALDDAKTLDDLIRIGQRWGVSVPLETVERLKATSKQAGKAWSPQRTTSSKQRTKRRKR